METNRTEGGKSILANNNIRLLDVNVGHFNLRSAYVRI